MIISSSSGQGETTVYFTKNSGNSKAATLEHSISGFRTAVTWPVDQDAIKEYSFALNAIDINQDNSTAVQHVQDDWTAHHLEIGYYSPLKNRPLKKKKR